MKHYCKRLLGLLIVCIVMSSCHERGCTDAMAINYNVTADEDDGSCIICKTTLVPFDSVILDIVDENGLSIHFNEVVAKVYLDQDIQSPSDQVCGKPTSNISIRVQSLVNETMYLYYRVQTYSGPISISDYRTVLISPHSSTEPRIIETINSPPFLQMSLDSLMAYTQSDIIYY